MFCLGESGECVTRTESIMRCCHVQSIADLLLHKRLWRFRNNYQLEELRKEHSCQHRGLHGLKKTRQLINMWLSVVKTDLEMLSEPNMR